MLDDIVGNDKGRAAITFIKPYLSNSLLKGRQKPSLLFVEQNIKSSFQDFILIINSNINGMVSNKFQYLKFST